jgi:hypothetical protein
MEEPTRRQVLAAATALAAGVLLPIEVSGAPSLSPEELGQLGHESWGHGGCCGARGIPALGYQARGGIRLSLETITKVPD